MSVRLARRASERQFPVQVVRSERKLSESLKMLVRRKKLHTTSRTLVPFSPIPGRCICGSISSSSSSSSVFIIVIMVPAIALLVQLCAAPISAAVAVGPNSSPLCAPHCAPPAPPPQSPQLTDHLKTKEPPQQRRSRPISQIGGTGSRIRRSPNESRAGGSKSEPPSRPTVDWSSQRPYFGADMARNVSVELGKTAYLTCKVHELGDKIVSWIRPRGNEILTSGKYTYISDSRFASINDEGSHDWILEIKDVGLNDSTSYECQVSTDPKISSSINLNVKAAKARIKQGTEYHAPVGSNIEFTCEISQRFHPSAPHQTYWYYNGNLMNYAKSSPSAKNFSIEWDPSNQTSRFKLFDVQLNDSGNYSCRPSSAEPATINLHIKSRYHKLDSKHRTFSSSKYHLAKDTDRLQDPAEKSSATSSIFQAPNSLMLQLLLIVVALKLL